MLDGASRTGNVNMPFCKTARYAHAEVNRALYHDWTVGQFVQSNMQTHNLRDDFTHEHLVSQNRELHDPCHLMTALGYKKLGMDTTDFRFWYNGNEIAEALTIPFERFFYSLLRPGKDFFSKDYYLERVQEIHELTKYRDEAKLKKARESIAVSLYPKAVFEVCRDAHFEVPLMKAYPNQSLRTDVTIYDENARWPHHIPSRHAASLFDTVSPLFELLKQELEPSVLTPYPKVELPVMFETVNAMPVRDWWEVISGEPYVRPTLKSIPSP